MDDKEFAEVFGPAIELDAALNRRAMELDTPMRNEIPRSASAPEGSGIARAADEAVRRQEQHEATAWAGAALVRDILEALCQRDGLSLDSAVDPGKPARNYELGVRLGIGHVFGLKEQA